MDDKMELTIREIVSASEGLTQLISRYKDELSITASLRVARLLRQLRPEVELYQQKRNELIVKHGKLEGDVYQLVQNSKGMLDFSGDERELLGNKTKLPIIPLDLESLGLERIDSDILYMVLPILEGA